MHLHLQKIKAQKLPLNIKLFLFTHCPELEQRKQLKRMWLLATGFSSQTYYRDIDCKHAITSKRLKIWAYLFNCSVDALYNDEFKKN